MLFGWMAARRPALETVRMRNFRTPTLVKKHDYAYRNRRI